MNNIKLLGRLSTEIELEKSGEHKYGRFNLAVPRRGKKEEADFINCVVFGKTADVMFEYCRKGHRILLDGRLQISQYEKNGEKKSNYSVVVDSIEFIEKKSDKQKDDVSVPADNSQATSIVDDEFPF